MRTEHLMNFDTHAAVKRLHAVGLEDRVAEEIVTSMVLSRDYDLSKLVTKEEFFKSKEENNERFNSVDKRFDAIDKEIALIRQEIKNNRKETKADIEALKKDVIAEIAKGKNDTIKWMVSLIFALGIAILIKLHF